MLNRGDFFPFEELIHCACKTLLTRSCSLLPSILELLAHSGLHNHSTTPSVTTTMDDKGSRKLILRLQIEDLPAIWVSSTTSTTKAATLHVDVSLSLCGQEQRTAEQRTEDDSSARIAGQDEMRQRVATSTDGEVAHRLSAQLNPGGPLPGFIDDSQVFIKVEPSPAPGPYRFSELSVVASSPSLVLQRTSLTPAGTHQSVNHLDVVDEPSLKEQAVGSTSSSVNSGISARTLALTSVGRKRPALENDSVAPLAKKPMPSTPPKSSLVDFGKTQLAAEPQPTSAVSRSAVSLSRRSSRTSTGAPLPRQPAGPRLGPISRSHLPFGADRRHDRTTSTNSENPKSQKLPASRQTLVAGQQPVVEQGQTFKVECVACCKKLPDSELYINSCSHAYCSKCIDRLFRNAIRDDSLWPPQCCKTVMPIESIEHLLNEDLVPLVNARQVKMSVPILERTYCVNCSAFVVQENIHENVAICQDCHGLTCTECKEAAHDGTCKQELEQDIPNLEAVAPPKVCRTHNLLQHSGKGNCDHCGGRFFWYLFRCSVCSAQYCRMCYSNRRFIVR